MEGTDCENTLEVTGERETIEQFLQAIKGVVDGAESLLDFNTIVPYPEKYLRDEKIEQAWEADWRRRGSPPGEWEGRPRVEHDAYEWFMANWGTCWYATSAEVGAYRRRGVRIEFDTEKTPPRIWLVAASNCFPTLSFSLRYWEREGGFVGHFVVREGDVLKDDRDGYSVARRR